MEIFGLRKPKESMEQMMMRQGYENLQWNVDNAAPQLLEMNSILLKLNKVDMPYEVNEQARLMMKNLDKVCASLRLEIKTGDDGVTRMYRDGNVVAENVKPQENGVQQESAEKIS